MIVKRVFNPIKVLGYVQTELLYAIVISSLVYLTGTFLKLTWVLPFSITAILGSALAIFIAFRNNTSYSRWWEARNQWSGIVNSSRVFARLTITFTDSHSNASNYNAERSETFKQDLLNYTIAWANALRLQLRGFNQYESLQKYLSAEDFQAMLNASNKANYLHLAIGRKIYQAMGNGTLAGFDSFQMEGQLLALANFQAACEKLKTTPLLRQYDFFTKLFLFVFMLFLPLSLYADLAKNSALHLLIPVSVVISFVFAIIGKVGEVNEDPFENKITDVPLDYSCATIERDLYEMLGKTTNITVPEPKDGYLF